MKQLISFLMVFYLATVVFSTVETITLKDGLNFEQKLAENDVFFKECIDFEILPGNNTAYFLDKTYGMIFKVDLKTGRLLKTISSKGQAPAELHLPVCLRIKNNMIFVLDKGFIGVKIFDLEGKFIDCFKVAAVLFDRRNLYVNEKNEIFVGKINLKSNTMVTVYDIKGNELRSLIPYLEKGEKDNNRASFTRKAYLLNLDSKGNVYILYYILRDLVKFDKNGQQLWKIHIKNEILDKFPEDDYAKINNTKVELHWYVFNFDITDNNDIVIGHAGGGCILTEDGKIKRLIRVNEKIGNEQKYIFVNLETFKIRENILLNLQIWGKYINIYKIMEELK